MSQNVTSVRMPGRRALLAVLAVTLLASCASMDKSQKGAAAGGAGGGALGAFIGHQIGSTAKGAIIGAVVGGIAGAVIGEQMDKQAGELSGDLEGARVVRVGEGLVVTFEDGILFGFDSSSIQGTARSNLQKLSASLQKYPKTDIVIVGHTDSKGTASYNQELSQRRSDSAASFLASEGVTRSRMRTSGKGEAEPISSNDNAAGQSQNRRVEVAIVADAALREQAGRAAN
jgi:outer membrane protein OmpA-like peptidoglycan-associated protein